MDHSPVKILIADDNPSTCSILRDYFRTIQNIMLCGIVFNGTEALEMIRLHKPDVVLLDIIMPEMDGLTFLRLKKETPEIVDIPVVIITADDTTEQQIDTMRMGADEYIVKPFIPEIVKRRIENVLDSSRSFRRMTHKSWE
jgi:DNA-binding response OmpR family regulator